MNNCCSLGYNPLIKNGECRYCLKQIINKDSIPCCPNNYSPFIKGGECRFCYKKQ